MDSIQEDPHKVEQRPQFVEQRPQQVEQVLKAGHCSTNCGTVSPKSSMLFQDEEQCATFNGVSNRSGLSQQKV